MGDPVGALTAKVAALQQKLVDTTQTVVDMKAKLDADKAAAESLATVVKACSADVDALGQAMQSSTGPGEAFVSTLNTLLDVQTAINDGYAQANTQGNAGSQSGYQAQVLSGLQKLEAGATALGPGQGSAIATMIDKIAQELAGGIINPSQAIQAIQALIGPYSSGLMQEVADPTLSPALKAFDEELLRLLAGGQLPS